MPPALLLSEKAASLFGPAPPLRPIALKIHQKWTWAVDLHGLRHIFLATMPGTDLCGPRHQSFGLGVRHVTDGPADWFGQYETPAVGCCAEGEDHRKVCPGKNQGSGVFFSTSTRAKADNMERRGTGFSGLAEVNRTECMTGVHQNVRFRGTSSGQERLTGVRRGARKDKPGPIGAGVAQW